MSMAQGQLLQVTVLKCNHLKATEYLSRQEDPLVCVEYGSNSYHTRTSSDGEARFTFTLFEGTKEISVSVYSKDDFIGRGRVQLQRLISQGYDDAAWPIFSESGRTTGEVSLLLHCPSNKQAIYPLTTASCYIAVSRGLKRPLRVEYSNEDGEELDTYSMRRKPRTETKGRCLQPTELSDVAMDEALDRTSPTPIEEDTEMVCGSYPPSPQYSALWDTAMDTFMRLLPPVSDLFLMKNARIQEDNKASDITCKVQGPS